MSRALVIFAAVLAGAAAVCAFPEDVLTGSVAAAAVVFALAGAVFMPSREGSSERGPVMARERTR